MIRLLLAFILILSAIFGCDTDKKSPPEKSGLYRFKKDTTQSTIEKPRLLGDDLFRHPGYSRETRREPPISKAKSVTVNNYLCEVKESADGKQQCMTFSRNGKKIRSDCNKEIGSFSILMSPPAGTDINGDGIPEIIVEYFSGGVHCCLQYTVFSLGKTLKFVTVMNGEHSGFEFKDIDGDGKYEAIGRDWGFAYWNASHARSPAPEVILRWEKGRYRLAERLMKKEYDRNLFLSTAKHFKDNAVVNDENSQSLHWESEWWAAMLELIYTGNGDLAWKLCDLFWPVSEDPSIKKIWLADKKKFLAEFKKQLRKSAYWADLKKMNGWN
jgi:hypothetical protein